MRKNVQNTDSLMTRFCTFVFVVFCRYFVTFSEFSAIFVVGAHTNDLFNVLESRTKTNLKKVLFDGLFHFLAEMLTFFPESF